MFSETALFELWDTEKRCTAQERGGTLVEESSAEDHMYFDTDILFDTLIV